MFIKLLAVSAIAVSMATAVLAQESSGDSGKGSAGQSSSNAAGGEGSQSGGNTAGGTSGNDGAGSAGDTTGNSPADDCKGGSLTTSQDTNATTNNGSEKCAN